MFITIYLLYANQTKCMQLIFPRLTYRICLIFSLLSCDTAFHINTNTYTYEHTQTNENKQIRKRSSERSKHIHTRTNTRSRPYMH